MHLAVAVNKPKVIAILGPTSSIRNGAFGHTNLISGLPCQPCHKKKCTLENADYMKCMNLLTAESVIKELDII